MKKPKYHIDNITTRQKKKFIKVAELVLEYMEDKKELPDDTDGMCLISTELCTESKITIKEAKLFELVIMDSIKRRYQENTPYIFKPRAIKYRVNYLNRLLKKAHDEKAIKRILKRNI